MFIVICYAIHNKKIASTATFGTYEDAVDNVKEDTQNTYSEEIENSGNASDEIDIEIDEDTAKVTDYSADCCWTWEIIEI